MSLFCVQEESSPAMLQQTTLHTLTALAGLCANAHPEVFEPCTPAVVALLGHHQDGKIQSGP